MEIYLLHKIELSSLFIIFKHGDLLVTFIFILQGKWKEMPQGVIKKYKHYFEALCSHAVRAGLKQIGPLARLIYSLQHTTTTHCRFYIALVHLAVCSIGGALLMTFQYYKLPIRIGDST